MKRIDNFYLASLALILVASGCLEAENYLWGCVLVLWALALAFIGHETQKQ